MIIPTVRDFEASGGVTDHTSLTSIGVNTHAQIDTHISDSDIHFSIGAIDHTSITSIGTNTHAQIDTHLALVNQHIDWTGASQGTIDATNIEDKFLRNDGDDSTAGKITAEEFIGYGVVPKGSILAWDKSDTGTPALPDGYQECNGQLDTDTDSIYYNQTVRSLNSGQNRFLRGNSTSGGTGGGTANHRHQLTLTGITAIAVASGGPVVNIVQAGNFWTHYEAPNVVPKYMDVVWIRRCK